MSKTLGSRFLEIAEIEWPNPIVEKDKSVFMVNREREIGIISSSTRRILFITGVGGAGKTKLLRYIANTEFIKGHSDYIVYCGVRDLLNIQIDGKKAETIIKEYYVNLGANAYSEIWSSPLFYMAPIMFTPKTLKNILDLNVNDKSHFYLRVYPKWQDLIPPHVLARISTWRELGSYLTKIIGSENHPSNILIMLDEMERTVRNVKDKKSLSKVKNSMSSILSMFRMLHDAGKMFRLILAYVPEVIIEDIKERFTADEIIAYARGRGDPWIHITYGPLRLPPSLEPKAWKNLVKSSIKHVLNIKGDVSLDFVFKDADIVMEVLNEILKGVIVRSGISTLQRIFDTLGDKVGSHDPDEVRRKLMVNKNLRLDILDIIRGFSATESFIEILSDVSEKLKEVKGEHSISDILSSKFTKELRLEFLYGLADCLERYSKIFENVRSEEKQFDISEYGSIKVSIEDTKAKLLMMTVGNVNYLLWVGLWKSGFRPVKRKLKGSREYVYVPLKVKELSKRSRAIILIGPRERRMEWIRAKYYAMRSTGIRVLDANVSLLQMLATVSLYREGLDMCLSRKDGRYVEIKLVASMLKEILGKV